MRTSAGSGDGKKGRVKRFSLLTLVLAAVILTALNAVYPKVDLLYLVRFAVALAVTLTILIEIICERSSK